MCYGIGYSGVQFSQQGFEGPASVLAGCGVCVPVGLTPPVLAQGQQAREQAHGGGRMRVQRGKLPDGCQLRLCVGVQRVFVPELREQAQGFHFGGGCQQYAYGMWDFVIFVFSPIPTHCFRRGRLFPRQEGRSFHCTAIPQKGKGLLLIPG